MNRQPHNRKSKLNVAHALTWISCVALAGCAQGPGRNVASGVDGISGNAQRFNAELQCGLLPISVSGQGEQLQLRVRGEQIDMQQSVSASGARYTADTEAENSLWFKGENASLTLDDMTYPECAAPGALVEPYRAAGNEPFWLVTLEHGMLQFSQLGEAEQAAQPFTFDRQTGELQSLGLNQGQVNITGHISNQICHDTMSGTPHPHQVSLQVGDNTLNGCGGDPARLIQGAEWVVEFINGSSVIDNSRVTLNFWPDGRLTGRASCNSLAGQYQLRGDGLVVGQTITTRMACAPALMSQEQAVLQNLEGLQRFDLTATGALLLHSANGTLQAHLDQP